MALIEYRSVGKQFGRKVVLDGVELRVDRGEILALMGPSGGGKTQLLKMLVGLSRPSSGEVWFDGRSIGSLGERRLLPVRKRIGFVFQSAALFDSITVFENVGYALRVAGATASTIEARVAECLALVSLRGTGQLRPAQLSGGMRKRIGIARALATSPEVMLYDEPTMGLDPANVRRVGELVTAIRDRFGGTALVVTHDRDLALEVADRLALLQDRHLAWVGSTTEARDHPPEVLERFLTGEDVPVSA
jgi:phospholipid/cholesterol/gamma-HCH transport system ATP-binding protein